MARVRPPQIATPSAAPAAPDTFSAAPTEPPAATGTIGAAASGASLAKTQEVIHRNVLIIGSGPAGYTAGIYAARANRNPLMVTGLEWGGQLTSTTEVENYPGFPNAIKGPDLMDAMRDQALRVGMELKNDMITSVDFGQRPFVAIGDSGTKYTADSVIIATGASAKWLGLPSEEQYKGAGVSGCATCDGFFFRDKDVAVVGGGNTAVEDALFLTKFAKSVTVIHRRDKLSAEKVMQDRLFANPKIKMVWNSAVEEIKGDENPHRVTGVHLRDVNTKAESDLAVDGVFVAIGHKPASGVFQGQIDIDSEGYIKTAPDSTATSIPGVFAAGDVKDKVFRQAVVAAGNGAMAAMEAETFLDSAHE